jgi:two-component system, sensor histidine kinase PdtaS
MAHLNAKWNRAEPPAPLGNFHEVRKGFESAIAGEMSGLRFAGLLHYIKLTCTLIAAGLLVGGALVFLPQDTSQSYAVFVALFAGTTYWLGQRFGYAMVGGCALALAYFNLEGEGFAVSDQKEALGLVGLILSGLLVVAVVNHLRRQLSEAETGCTAARAESANRAALLSEMAHRIFNDLCSLTSLANLRALRAEHEETRHALESIANQIYVFSSVYRRLHVSDATAETKDLAIFLNGLCDDLREAHLGLRPVALNVHVEPWTMPSGKAVVVGLILNEAVNNALKYAFPDAERSGVIQVTFGPDPDKASSLVLRICDDGIGPSSDVPMGTGLGQRLMRLLAAQLGGTYHFERRGDHTVVTLRFPAP